MTKEELKLKIVEANNKIQQYTNDWNAARNVLRRMKASENITKWQDKLFALKRQLKAQ